MANKNTRGKFSNGGGSIGGVQDFSLDGGLNGINGRLITINRQQVPNGENFLSNPNSTSSRFYNPVQQASPTENSLGSDAKYRAVQNLAKIKGANQGAFQNNFLLPKASPNGGMMKTFYNTKQPGPVQPQRGLIL